MNSNIEERLKAIGNATPTFTPYSGGIFNITLAEGNAIEYAVQQTPEGQRIARMEHLHVLKVLQGHGIGTRLIRSAFRHCAELGAEYVDSGVINATVLRIYGRVFGEAALRFLHPVEAGEEAGEIELPLNLEQATASLERAYKVWEASSEEEWSKMDPGIKVRIYLSDLAEIDTSSWESPVPLQ